MRHRHGSMICCAVYKYCLNFINQAHFTDVWHLTHS